MTKWIVILMAAGLCAGVGLLYAQDSKTPPAAPAETKIDMANVSYCIGVNFARRLKTEGVELNIDSFVEGFKAAAAGQKLKMTDEEMGKLMEGFGVHMAAAQQKRIQELAEKNRKEGEAYLAANKGKEGVKVAASGLQYKVVKAGKGKTPGVTDTVTVHYRGKLLDGTEFDSSYKRNEPATFRLDQVIPGWSEGVQLMNEGAVYELVIPSDLAYGPRGAPQGGIGPNATLLFEIELLKIAPAEQPK